MDSKTPDSLKNQSAKSEPIGLIAGAGRAPMMVADGIIASGHKLVTAGLKGFCDPKLAGYSDEFRWVGLSKMGSWISYFKKAGVSKAVMIGSVRKSDMYCRFRLLKFLPDFRSAKIWYCKIRKDKRDAAVLLAVAEELSSEGIELMSSVEYCSENLANLGVMTKSKPSASLDKDIEFGWGVVCASADLDIGQSLAIKERDIIAVEAVEGTDAMIARAGKLCKKGGWTMLKVARSNQDMRFDVPTIGPDTLRNLHQARCKCLVIEAEKTLIADKTATLDLADKLGITIVGKAR